MEKEPSPLETILKIRMKSMLRNSYFGRGKTFQFPPLTKEEIETYNKALEEFEKESENESAVTHS